MATIFPLKFGLWPNKWNGPYVREMGEALWARMPSLPLPLPLPLLLLGPFIRFSWLLRLPLLAIWLSSN
jgi:hypothetical protein